MGTPLGYYANLVDGWPEEIEMRQIELARFKDLGAGHEKNLLPASTHRIRETGITFPVSSEALAPLPPAVIDQPSPRFSLFHFERATLHGFRLLEVAGKFAHDLSLVSDTALSFPARPELKMPENVAETGAGVGSVTGRTNPDTIRGALLCSIHEPGNYGSILFRLLPKLLLTRKIAPERPILVHSKVAWIRHIIELAAPGAEIIHHESTISHPLEDVLVPSLGTPDAYLRPVIRDALSEFLDRLPQLPSSPERIYLSRRDQAKKKPFQRALENEDELVERLAERGIVEYVPERHPFEHQARTIAQAKLIVCPGGSGLFNAYFARNAEMIVDLESAREWLHAHRNVLASSGCPFTLVRGLQNPDVPVPHGELHRNWFVDIDALMDGLKRLDLV